MSMLNLIDVEGYFEQIKSYKNIVLFGCGAKGRQGLKILQDYGVVVTKACDNNKDIWDKEFSEGVYIRGGD